MNFIFGTAKATSTLNGSNVWLTKMTTHIEMPERQKAITPQE